MQGIKRESFLLRSVLLFCIFAGIFYLTKDSYILFHTTVETIIIAIAFAIMIIVINTYKISENFFLTFLGIVYGFVGGITILHTLTYKGMNILSVDSPNVPTQLWIASRFIESISLLVSFKLIKRKISVKHIFCIYTVLSVIFISLIFQFKIFPACYIEGYGLTEFKILSEYIIIGVFGLSAYFLYKNQENFKKSEQDMLKVSIFFAILCELAFTLYQDVYGILNMTGHIFNLISYYALYNAIIVSTLREPYNVIFKGLNEKTEELEVKNQELLIKNKELKNANIIIQKNKERYRKLVKLLPDAIIVREGEKIIYVNDAAAALLKIKDKKQVVGMSVMNFIHEDYKDKVKDRINIEKNKEWIPPAEQKLIRADGKDIDVEVSVLETYFDDKKCNISVIRDISERKKIEQMRLQYEVGINSDKLKNEFFANLSHELKTPVNTIYSTLQLEDYFIRENDMDAIKQYNEIIKNNCFRLLRTASNLIDITEIDEKFYKINNKYSNIVELVEEASMSALTYIKKKEMEIIFDTVIEEIWACCDPDLIQRVVLNLLSNSVKYGIRGGSIWVKVYDKGENVLISIKDDGLGIPKDKQPFIFERFMKADSSLTRSSEGSGIGLSLVKALIDLQGGTISFKSEEGVGTEFFISLPACDIDEECCVALEDDMKVDRTAEKASIEFSDIYFD